jgi:hypothetical protein
MPYGSLDFDPNLTRLQVAFDLPAVSRLFEEGWPGTRALPGATSVRANKLLDTKYEPRVSCVTTYDLVVATQNGSGRTIGTLEMSPSQTVLRTLEHDRDMPSIAEALDANAMARRFTSSVPGLEGEATGEPSIIAVRYKPGARCVLRYTFPTTSGARVFFGKIVAMGSDLLARSISSLQEASSKSPEMPLIAGPVAYWPDMRMLAQRAVEGAELHEVAFDATVDVAVRERWMGQAGRGLAGLHRATGVPAASRTISDDTQELEAYAPPMAQADPELAGTFARAVDSLRGFAEPEGTDFVASHGAFRTDQFMIQGDELVMIDLDSFCRSEPERDLGNLLGYLRWKAMRQPQHASFIEAAPKHFLDGYGAVRPPPDQRRIVLYEAASLLKIAGRRFRSLTVREWPKVPHLIDTAARLLL